MDTYETLLPPSVSDDNITYSNTDIVVKNIKEESYFTRCLSSFINFCFPCGLVCFTR